MLCLIENKNMIKIVLGNLGSGKTAYMVREMALNLNNRRTYSNIITNLKNQVNISPEMIIKKEVVGYKVNKSTNEKEEIYKYKLNKEYWTEVLKKEKAINICLDESANLIDSRRSQTNVNIIFTQWLFMLRRIIGQTQSGYGELTFITQLLSTIDNRARDLATNIVYTIGHFQKTCEMCGASWQENSEMPEGYIVCPMCKSNKIFKHSHRTEVWAFPNINLFQMWHQFGQKTFYKHFIINNIEDYMSSYNHLQWEFLFEGYY